ncbi:MAG: DUF4340 domain-containing protein [Nitrospinota bacterium]|nr:DUF4340 domain-containing protein [Nitrospinota bacterium]
MRYFKNTFIWIIILVGIAGYSFIDKERLRMEEVAKDEATRLLPFEPIEVLAAEIRKEGEVSLELERWEDGWKIVKPIEAKADNEAVEKFLDNVLESRNDADYVMDTDPSPERLAEFGLSNPKLFLTLKVGKELTPHTVVFGDRAPSMGVAFAQLEGEKPVYRVLANTRAEADKDEHYFRDKSVLRINPIMVDQLAINTPKMNLRVKLPDEGKWVLEKPLKARADQNSIFEIMSAFANTDVKEFIEETKENKGKYGLDNPSTELMFWISGDSNPTVRIQVGKRSPEKRGYFVSMSDRENIFLLEEEVINAIPRNPNELRSKELFFIEQENIKRIEIKNAKKTIVLLKDVDKEWKRDKQGGEIVDFKMVKEFLDDLAEVKIEDFLQVDSKGLAEYGLNSPSIQLFLWEEGRTVPFSLSVGKKTPTGNQVYASSGLSSEVLVLNDYIQQVLKTYFF